MAAPAGAADVSGEPGVAVVTELARRFAAGDGASGAAVVQVTSQTRTAKATGRSATVDVAELFGFRDGLVSKIRVFQQDTALLLRTLE